MRVAGELGRTVAAKLNADMAIAALHVLPHAGFERGEVLAAGMRITIHREAALAAEQLVNRHSGALAFDIP